ncbi:hypothetical protein MAJ_11419, partial [Metarhizium majus ARSEF 297]
MTADKNSKSDDEVGGTMNVPPDDVVQGSVPKYTAESYATHIFAAERCDSNGYPMSGDFCRTGDSGAPVIDMSGYVLGLVVQGRGYDGGTLGLINRIDQIQAALDVTLHAD